MTLEPTTDVLRTLGERRPTARCLIGFAAEHGDEGLARARDETGAQALDLVVYNDISRGDIGFDAGDNEVVLISAAGERRRGEGAERPNRVGDRRYRRGTVA